MDQPVDITDRKAALRAAAKRRRAEAAVAAPEAAAALAERLLAAVPPPAGAVVSGYWPMGDEIDTRPLLAALHARGHVIGLPVIERKGAPLLFRSWAPDVPLQPGGFGTQVPGAGAAVVSPGYLLVPLLAFDRAGYRLGYGGGFYDRTLQQLRGSATTPPLAVGVAFAGQEMSAVPRDATDEALDWIVTEAETICVSPSAGPALPPGG